MKFSFFHLMPYTGLEHAPGDWPVPNRDFDGEKARALEAVVRKGMELFRDRVHPEVGDL